MKPCRRAAATALGVVALLAASTPSKAGVDGDESAPRTDPVAPPEERERRFVLKVSLEGRYDDDILQLSESDKRQLESGSQPGRFRIQTADDTIAIARVDFSWRGRPLPRRQTSAEVALDAHQYARNEVKNFEELALSIHQEITASRKRLASLRLVVSRIPEFYLRQLKDDDESFAAQRPANDPIRNAATFAQNEYSIVYRQEIVDARLESRLGWSHRERNFNHHFAERDNNRRGWSLALQGRPFGRSSIEVGLEYDTGALRARGDLPSSPIPDDDISYRFHAASLDVDIRWKARRRGRLELSFRRERRDFTSGNAFDPCHSTRHDDRRDYRALLLQHLARGLDLVAEIRRVSNDAGFPGVFSTCEDVTDFVENRVSLGLSWSHRF